mgnify:CR=1 FL=1
MKVVDNIKGYTMAVIIITNYYPCSLLNNSFI